MSTHPHPIAPHSSTREPSAEDRHDGWTPRKQAAFLETLAATQCVSTAAREVGMSRQSAYRLRARLRGQPFDMAWEAAFHCAYDALMEAAMERALNGVEVPHFHAGELIHVSRRFDERLTLALLALRPTRRRPSYSSRHPASDYPPDDFAALLDRVGEGPETWEEERAAREAEEEAEDARALEEEAQEQAQAEQRAARVAAIPAPAAAADAAPEPASMPDPLPFARPFDPWLACAEEDEECPEGGVNSDALDDPQDAPSDACDGTTPAAANPPPPHDVPPSQAPDPAPPEAARHVFPRSLVAALTASPLAPAGLPRIGCHPSPGSTKLHSFRHLRAGNGG